jgi:ankyrin repeat protein
MMDSGTMLNRSCVLGLPSVTRNLLEAGAHMESSCRITGDNDSNGYPLENCLAFCEDLYSNYGGSSLIDQKLEVLDVLLKHQALNINTQVRKSGHFKMTILQSLLMSSSSGPKYHPLRKEFAKHKWRQEYYYLSRKAALRLLEEPTINISFIEPLTGGNIVRAACYHNSPTVLQRLIDLGADINNVDCDNITPLFYCLSNDYFECAKVLASAKGHRKDVLNMIHIKGGLCEVNLKKNGGKDIDKQLCQIGYGNTIATWATLRLGTQQEELFELICQIPGIDLNKSSEMMFNAGTPLQTAAMIGNYKRVKVLLKYGGTHETWKLENTLVLML